MPFHLAVYSQSKGSVTDSDLTAPADTVLATPNSHLIISESFNLLGAYFSSTTLTRANFSNIGLSFRGLNNIWPLGRTDTVASRPMIADYRNQPVALPLNEEITIAVTTDAVGPIVAQGALWLAKPNWSPREPVGQEIQTVRATFTPAAGTASTWGADNTLTFERALFNGVYAVTGVAVAATTASFFRMLFPSAPLSDGRQLRPGGLATTALGDFPLPAQLDGFGEWGRFHTFEPPRLQMFGVAGATAHEVRLNLTYLGSDRNLLFAGR